VLINRNLPDTVLPEEGYEIHDDDENGSADFRYQKTDIESGQQDEAKFPSSGTPGHENSLLMCRHNHLIYIHKN